MNSIRNARGISRHDMLKRMFKAYVQRGLYTDGQWHEFCKDVMDMSQSKLRERLNKEAPLGQR